MKKLFSILVVTLALPTLSSADQRRFGYSYDTTVLPAGSSELEQWITNQNGKESGDYSEWNLRTELEHGFTNSFQGSLYLNWDSVHQEGLAGEENKNETDFKGISFEGIYQLLNPNTSPVGLGTYLEYSTDGIDQEVEAKILLSKAFGPFEVVGNVVYEAENEKADGEREHEGTFMLTGGVSYSLNPNWAFGAEFRNKSAYPGGFDLKGQEFNSWSLGPNVHYSTAKWWATLTVLPQIWGNGDGSKGSRQLVHEESVETRLLIGIDL